MRSVPPSAAAAESVRQPALFRLSPALRSALGWVPLGQFPTEVHSAPELARELGCDDLWLKREDRSGADHGGNKVRKLEWLLGDGVRRRSSSVVSIGAVGSNHVVATTFYARRLGLRSHAVVMPQPMHPNVARNLAAALGLGCHLHFTANESRAAARFAALQATVWQADGVRPCVCWPGGSSPRGVLGFVEAGLEIAAQVREGQLPEPAFVFVPLGSGGTLAGLVLGLRIAGLRTVPVGVRVYDRLFANETTVLWLARRARALLARTEPWLGHVAIEANDVRVLHGHAGPGYGHPTTEGGRAAELARLHAGLELDPTYSAKALAGLQAFMAHPKRRGQRALFVCTFNSRPLDTLVAACPPVESLPLPLRAFLDHAPSAPGA